MQKHLYFCTLFIIHKTFTYTLSFEFSVSILDQMAAVRKRNESSVIDQIGDDLLSWVSTVLWMKLYFLYYIFSYIE